MNSVLAAIAERHCKRAFLPTPVPLEPIRDILTAAAQAPSSKNTQPWHVGVVSDRKRDQLSDALLRQFDAGLDEGPDYPYSASPLPPDWRIRAKQCGYDLFALKGIDKSDHMARRNHARENFLFFGAPTVLVFSLPQGAAPGAFLDMGFFMQNVMLGLVGIGMGSCPQYSVAHYPNTIRHVLGWPQSRLIVCGMAVGIPDPNAAVNRYRPPRAPLSDYVEFFE